MATRFYKKEIPESPVYVAGVPLKFEVLSTEDPTMIAELDRCIHFGRGGIVSITAEQFEEESKKKQTGISSESGYKQQRQRQELSSLHTSRSLAVGADVRIGEAFASPQLNPFGGPMEGRAHTPRNQFGLPGGPAGPTGGKPMPDPIELPTGADFKPPTAKLVDVLI